MTAVTPYLIAMAAVVLYASLSPALKKFQIDNIPPFAFIAITMACLAFCSAIISLLYERDFSVLKVQPKTWLGLIGFSAINLTAFVFYIKALNQLPVTQYQLVGLLSPVAGGFLAYVFLGEAFKIEYLYGLGFIGTGLFIALRGGAQ